MLASHDWITEKYVIVYMIEEEETCNRTAEILSQAGVCNKRMFNACTAPQNVQYKSIPTINLLGASSRSLIAHDGNTDCFQFLAF
jgi:hypothetical protein